MRPERATGSRAPNPPSRKRNSIEKYEEKRSARSGS